MSQPAAAGPSASTHLARFASIIGEPMSLSASHRSLPTQRHGIPLLVSLLAIALLGGCDSRLQAADSAAQAPAASGGNGVQVTEIATGLEHPWGLAFLPDGEMLVTERPGRLRRVAASGTLSPAFDGVPEVLAQGQGGLLDVVLSPQFDSDRLVYLSYSEPGDGGRAGTAVARGRLDGDSLRDVEVIFRQEPKVVSGHHYGSRLVFDGKGHLFVTLGDRGDRPTAQDLGSHMGGVIRVHEDGRVPADNPFVGREDARPEIWSFGHRNIQGAALHPGTGKLWTHEHGPRGGDEINLPQPGLNYGWPIVTHGINYSGAAIPEAVGREKEGMEPPHHVWMTSPGVSGMAFYQHERHPQWRNSLFVGALAQKALIRLSLDGDAIGTEERLLGDRDERIRDVRVSPDGEVYVLTDHPSGKLLRVSPAG
jgi:aldose sugar dehydrogenase